VLIKWEPTDAYTLQHTTTHCDTLRYTATHCDTLQHTTTHSNKHLLVQIKCERRAHTSRENFDDFFALLPLYFIGVLECCCDMTPSYAWYDSFICMTWLSLICATCVKCFWCLVHSLSWRTGMLNNMTHSYVEHDSYAQHDPFMHAT